MSDHWQGNLRVRYDSPTEIEWEGQQARERTAPQKHTDHALEEAEKSATEALHLAEGAVAWLGSVNGGNVKNQEAPRYLLKLIEEIAEVKRMRG